MQEEIEHKTVNFAISTVKLSARTLLKGAQFFLRQYDKSASQGKQSMNRLIRQNRGVTNLEIEKTGIPDQHLVQLRPYSVHRGRVIRSPAKQSGIEPVFSKTTKQQELGVAVHAPAKSGIWLILDATSKKAKRKAPYFKRSTVLFWWRIAGSNR